MRSLLTIVSVILAGIAVRGTTASVSAGPDEWKVADEHRAVPNPVSANGDVVAEGESLYKQHCLLCHGVTGKGDGKMTKVVKPAPKDISTAEAQERLTDGEIFYKIGRGKEPMPALEGKLSEEERWKVVHYVRTLRAP